MKKYFIVVVFISLVFEVQGQSILDNLIIKKSLSQAWELDSIDKKGTFRFVSYKPVYITAARWTSNPNTMPVSENPVYSATEESEYNNFEAKFQISFKTKILQSVFFGLGDIWVGYTQKAHWQVYNKTFSRAFRELNYEPEIIVNFPLKTKLFSGNIRQVGFSLNHQSNGKEIPLSRSWNRVIFDIGYEIDNWIVNLRPWYRLKDKEDENPDITKYIGSMELYANYHYEKHEFYTIITHPLNSLKRGGIQINYVFPIRGNIRAHAQLFHGYGETLLDYNHLQTTAGLGISFANW
ncbi:MAG: phospholipase A1 [Flavobacterium sp.]|jgi:phospholipase A1